MKIGNIEYLGKKKSIEMFQELGMTLASAEEKANKLHSFMKDYRKYNRGRPKGVKK